MFEVANTFDVIIDTVPYTHDLKPYVPTLALDGTLVLVGLVGELEQTIIVNSAQIKTQFLYVSSYNSKA